MRRAGTKKKLLRTKNANIWTEIGVRRTKNGWIIAHLASFWTETPGPQPWSGRPAFNMGQALIGWTMTWYHDLLESPHLSGR
jgi:hypothetical protein